MANGKVPEQAIANLTTGELVKEITSRLGFLVKKQIHLAKSEIKADLRTEMVTTRTLGIAAVAALVAVNLLLVTGALILALFMPAWAAGLLVTALAAAVAAAAAAIGWKRRLRGPTAGGPSIDDQVRWTKERLA